LTKLLFLPEYRNNGRYLPLHPLEIFSVTVFSEGETYAGNIVCCAAAVAVADVMKEDNILRNVQAWYGYPLTLSIDVPPLS
jgi:hypothetical protein